MTRTEILDFLMANISAWPSPPTPGVHNEVIALRGMGWEWFTYRNTETMKVEMRLQRKGEPYSSAITEGEFYDHVMRQFGSKQGDPNAHESVRSGYVVERPEIGVRVSSEPVEWDGVGAPTVGSFVEYGDDEFAEAVVIGRGVIDPSSIVIEFRDGGIEVTEVSFLRPIRSEREKAVGEMMQEAGYSASDCYVSDYHVVALVVEAIYDAGYRKTVGE
jgi:hypothetical protein